MTALTIGDNVELPTTIVTSTVAILGMRGGGKSSAAVVMAEQMTGIGAQWVALDPKGDWHGVRSSADGTGPGLPVPVFGGLHGDLPLEPAAGTLMARLVIERDLTAVLDISGFSKAEQIRFAVDFAETLFKLARVSPRPLHGEQQSIAESLSGLAPGESWIMSPGYLGTIERVQWNRRSTFDSGATPVAGAVARTPMMLADIDVGEIKELMADTIERAEADDPKTLRRRITELEHQLAAPPAVTERVVEVEVPIVPSKLIIALVNAHGALEIAARDMIELQGRVLAAVTDVQRSTSNVRALPEPKQAAQVTAPRRLTVVSAPAPPGDVDDLFAAHKITPNSGARRMLDALAAWPNGLTKSQLGTHAKVKKSGGSFGTYVSRLRAAGLITTDGDFYQITEHGLEAAGGARPPMDPAESRAFWRSKFTGGCQRMFDLLVDNYHAGFDKAQLSEAAGISTAGGSWGTYLSRLRSNGCIRESDGFIYAHDDLFLGS